ncbi:MAG: HAMP domain-containing sensor histidine kinase [Pseudomonadota bacterium]
MIIFPAAIAVLTSWGNARPALLCAIVSLLGLALMSMFDLVPPPIQALSSSIGWWAVGGAIVTFLIALLTQLSLAADADDASSQTEETLPNSLDIAGLSHDLKSPLTSILGFSQVMRDRELGPDPAAYETYPEFIHQSALTLEERVKALLTLMESDSGALELNIEDVDVAELISQVVERLGGRAQTERVTLEVSAASPTLIKGDHTACERVLENLISNAIKYSDPDSCVSIVAETDESWVTLIVADEGTGIAGEDLAKLAEPYTQASHSGTREGTGLGLALVKRLVELQQGEFRIRTAYGRGTQMIVKLPAAR